MGLRDRPARQEMSEEIAFAVENTNRSLWGGGLVRGLTPRKLAGILDQVRGGECPAEYIEIAQELEQRDPHYRSVLSTRKHAVEGLALFVQASGDSTRERNIAQAVEDDIMKHRDIMDLRKNILDALGKGFSVNEILWDTSGPRWKPKTFIFRDPRWFSYDKESGELGLRALTGNDISPLEPFRFIVHEPNLLSGPQITSGLSFTALFYWLIKNYDVTSWAAFVDRFGYPIRMGKYGKKATREDIATLKRAVAAIGSDVGAVIPDSMVIDIVESKSTGANAKVYQELAEWVDKELSKLVLGQTASAEGTAGKLGDSEIQREVRDDIARADALQFEQTINRDLVIPYVNFNFGEQQVYPQIKIKLVEKKNVSLIVDSVQKLAPLGLRVSKAEMLTLLGLSAPADDEEVLAQPVPQGYGFFPDGRPPLESAVTDPVDLQNAGNGFIAISEETVEVLEKALDKSTDFSTFREELAKDWPPEKIAEFLAVATFKARLQGHEEFDG